MARTVDQRIAHMADRKNWPTAVGQCAHTVWMALGVPPLGAASASIALAKVRKAGHLRTDKPRRGGVALWSGGSHGYGHAALLISADRILSTDYPHAKDVGEAPLSMPAHSWGLTYEGWTDWWGTSLPM